MTDDQEQEQQEAQEAEAVLSAAMVDQGYFRFEEDYPGQNLRFASKLIRVLKHAGFEIRRRGIAPK